MSNDKTLSDIKVTIRREIKTLKHIKALVLTIRIAYKFPIVAFFRLFTCYFTHSVISF